MTSWADDDEQLWRELQAAVRETQTVSPRQVAAARGAFSWRTVDAELLRLSEAADGSDLALVRGTDPGDRRSSLFRGPTSSIELEFADGHATGQILPAQACRLVKTSVEGVVTEVDVDESGFFQVTVEERERFRLRFEVDGKSHVTEWVTV